MKTVLISGGTGLIGNKLREMLMERGYQVRILSRQKSNDSNTVFWDIENGIIQSDALEGITSIIHLAGEGIANAQKNRNLKLSKAEYYQLTYFRKPYQKTIIK